MSRIIRTEKDWSLLLSDIYASNDAIEFRVEDPYWAWYIRNYCVGPEIHNGG